MNDTQGQVGSEAGIRSSLIEPYKAPRLDRSNRVGSRSWLTRRHTANKEARSDIEFVLDQVPPLIEKAQSC